MKLKFTQDGIVNGQVVFKKGEIYDISDELGSATRWIKRGAVVVKDGEVEQKVEDKKEAEEVEEVVIKQTKKENKKENKSSKQG
jgi:hypothetical protein